MNITQTSNKCTQKCTYSFNYPETSIRTVLSSSSLNINITPPNVPSVKFNGNDYNATRMILVYPSTNTYNGVKADAEAIIYHVSTTVNKPLIVSVPISAASNTKPLIMNEIINQTAKLLPKTNYVNLKVENFSLNDFVPDSQFYYTETSQLHYIMYDLNQSLSLSSDIFATLKKIVITPYVTTIELPTEPELFYNNEGPNTKITGGQDFNFMQCEEVYEEETSTQPSSMVSSPIISQLTNNPKLLTAVMYSVGMIISILLLYVFYKIITSYLAK